MSYFQLTALTEPAYTDEGLKHAVLQSLLNWEKAQNNDPLDEGQDKQGWWGSEIVEAVGCRDWTLARAKQTPDTANRVKRYTEQALQWLINNTTAKTITVTVSYEGVRLTRIIDLTLKDNTLFQVTV